VKVDVTFGRVNAWYNPMIFSGLANFLGLLLEKAPPEPELQKEILEEKQEISCPEPTQPHSDQMSTLVCVKMAEVHVVFIHPDNSTYPFCQFVLELLAVEVKVYEDQTAVHVNIKDFKVDDLSNFPETLDPLKMYGSDEPVERF